MKRNKHLILATFCFSLCIQSSFCQNITSSCRTFYWYEAYNKLAIILRRDSVCAGISHDSLPSVSGYFGPQETPIKNFVDDIKYFGDYESESTYNPLKKGKNNNIYFKKIGQSEISVMDGALIAWDWDDSIWQDQPGGRAGVFDSEIDRLIYSGADSLSDGDKGFADGSIYYFDNDNDNICDPDEEVWLDSVQFTALRVLLADLRVRISILQQLCLNPFAEEDFSGSETIPTQIDSVNLFPDHSEGNKNYFTLIPSHLEDGTQIAASPIFTHPFFLYGEYWKIPALPIHFEEIRQVVNKNLFKCPFFSSNGIQTPSVVWDNKGENNARKGSDTNYEVALSQFNSNSYSASGAPVATNYVYENAFGAYHNLDRKYSYLCLKNTAFPTDNFTFEADFYVKAKIFYTGVPFNSQGDPVIENKWNRFAQQSTEVNNLEKKLGSLNLPQPGGYSFSNSRIIVIKWNFPDANIPPFESPISISPDTNRDDLVDIGIDMNNIQNETGTISHYPEMDEPQLLLPVRNTAKNGINFVVHDYLSQGNSKRGRYCANVIRSDALRANIRFRPQALSSISPNLSKDDILTHRASTSYLFYDLYINDNDKNIHVKRLGLLRPKGQVVTFDFPWDAENSKFSSIGSPIGINSERTYRLICNSAVDKAPDDDYWITSYSLQFDSRITHLFYSQSVQNNNVPTILDFIPMIGIRVDNEMILADPIYWYGLGSATPLWSRNASLDYIKGFKYDISYKWNEDALISELIYVPKDGNTDNQVTVELVYNSEVPGKITKLKKTVPQSLAINGQTKYEISIEGDTITYPGGSTSKREQTAPAGHERTVTITKTIPNAGTTVSKYYFNASDLVTKLEVTTNGKTATTIYTYYESGTVYPNTTKSEHKLKSIKYTNGTWEHYTYNSKGWLERIYRPLKNTPTEPGITQIFSEYLYTPHDINDLVDEKMVTESPRTISTELLGHETSRDYLCYNTKGVNTFEYKNASTEKQSCKVPGAAWDASSNLVFKLTKPDWFLPININPLSLSEIAPTENSASSFVFSEGPLVDSNSSEYYRIHTSVTKTDIVTSSDGISLNEVTTITNSRGVVESRIVKDYSSGETMESAVFQTDLFGRIKVTTYLDGTTEKFEDYCLYGPTKITDRLGNVTSREYYANGLVKKITGPINIVEYTYDALGNTTSETTTPKQGIEGEAITESWTYDAQSRVTSHTNTVGTTTYVYNGPDVTITYPDKTTKIIDKNLDGTIASISGTAVSPVSYDYGVDESKGYWTKSETPDGVWSQTFYNMLGQSYRTETSSGYWSETAFDDKGRPQSVADSSSRTQSVVYNGKNEVSKTIANSIETTHEYDITQGNHVKTSTLKAGGDIGDIVTVNTASLNGLTSSSTVNGHTTTSVTSYPGNGVAKTTTTDPWGRVTENTSSNISASTALKAGSVDIANVTSSFDGNGRIRAQEDSRIGTSVFSFRTGTGQIATATTPAGEITTNTYEDNKYEPVSIKTPYNATVTPLFDDKGNFKGFSSDSVAFGIFDSITSFDDQQRLTNITTKGGTQDNPLEAETKWNYGASTGFLEGKTIAGTSVFSQDFHADGRPKTKKIGSASKTFNYTNAPQLFPAGVSYDDNVTPNVTATEHNVFGQPAEIATDGVCKHAYSYNKDLQITDDTFTDLKNSSNSRSTSYTYPNLLRAKYTSGSNVVDYTYDNAKRIKTVKSDGITAEYTYVENTVNLIDKITIKRGDTVILVRDFDYEDNSNRVTAVSNTYGSNTDLFGYVYYDKTNKIKTLSMPGGIEHRYYYDTRGQLTSDTKQLGALRLAEYGYKSDSITNILEGGRVLFGNLPEFEYTPTVFNTISMRRSGNTIEVSGTADKNATIVINEEKLERDGDEAFIWVTDAGNQDEAVYFPIKITGVLFDELETPMIGGDQSGNVPGSDLIQEIEGSVYMPKNPETPVYDQVKGHFVEDSTKKCYWDFENRLRGIESKLPGKDGKYTYQDNIYDHAGRRIKKSIYKKSSPSASWPETPVVDHFFYYDGTLLDGSPAPFGIITGEMIVNHESGKSNELQYLWGLDLNGSYQGSGGIGGLLAVIDKTDSNNIKTFIPVMDKKGTVHSYIDAVNGSTVAKFAYSPYGNVVKEAGEQANILSLRYNNKYYDNEFSLYYHDTRFLDPTTCKWLSRDVIGESGGTNLYAYCNNDPVNKFDYLGLKAYLVYRPLNIGFLRYTSPLTGHVYLAFDDECTTKKWKDELKRHQSKGININVNDYHTFSFHPWSVRQRTDKNGNQYHDKSHDKLGVLVTEGSDVLYRDVVGDVDTIIDKIASLMEVTSNEDEQIRLFKIAVASWKKNSASAKSNDIGYYSFATNNCAHWAVTMVRKSGLPVPPLALGYNFGAGVGGPMDWTGLPYATYHSARFGVDTYDFTLDQGGQFSDALLEGWGLRNNPTPPQPPRRHVGFMEALRRGWGF